MGNIDPIMILLIPVLLLSISLHELAHAWTAKLAGDMTATSLGRITLNPLAHIDPIGTILVPLLLIITHAGFLFGWAKPVPIDPRNFKRDYWNIIVSLAGPASNLLLALVAAVGLKIILMTGASLPGSLGGSNPSEVIGIILFLFLQINIVLMVFNLMPIPPLDGSHVLFYFLRRTTGGLQLAGFLERYGFIIFILFITMPVTRDILSYVINLVFSLLFRLVGIL